jgi:hypothetical protein
MYSILLIRAMLRQRPRHGYEIKKEQSVRSVGRVSRPTQKALNGGQEERMSNQFSHLALTYRRWIAPLGWTVASVAALGALFLPASPAVSTWLWVAFFLLAGTLCSSVYVRRCSRFHCYITGPLFLLSAFYLSTVELSLVPFMGNTWFLVVVLGTTALAFLVEMIFGKQVARGVKNFASH